MTDSRFDGDKSHLVYSDAHGVCRIVAMDGSYTEEIPVVMPPPEPPRSPHEESDLEDREGSRSAGEAAAFALVLLLCCGMAVLATFGLYHLLVCHT